MFYKDLFGVKEGYAPCMTKEAINRDPETWLQFYPHKTFVDLLRTLLDKLNGGNQSVWLTGPYGTGKSHAALVLQKLFMDEEVRLDEWLVSRKALLPKEVVSQLKQLRAQNVLVIFDTGSDTVTTPHHLLVRIERAIQESLIAKKHTIPLMGSLEEMIVRVRREGSHFFNTRDAMQDELCYLTGDIKTVDAWERQIRKPELTNGLVSDTMRVLEQDDIYLGLSADNLIKWINAALDANGISKILFIWDEFSNYVQRHAGELKTFETIAEASQEGRFFFMPVTHMEITAYMAAGSASAKKANDRFVFKALDMPTNTALVLGADAFEIKKSAAWEKERTLLWHSVRGVVENYMLPKAGEQMVAEDFKGILPIHPMAAFVLKHLATAVGSNQRSMFNYLKRNSGDSEFQQFIAAGGPDVRGMQFLTVDYLWRYFIERDDLGRDKEVQMTQTEFSRKSSALSETDIRIFKTVLLYSLLGRRTQGGGHELLQPTIENIVRAFEGDGVVVGVEGILQELARQHCFSIVNGRCEMFRSEAGGEELAREIEKIEPLFNSLILADKTQPKLESKLRTFKDKQRFVVQVSSVEKCTPGAMKNKDQYGPMGNKVLVYFILARDAQDQLLIPEKAKILASHFKDFRILFVTMPEATFCDDNANRWQEYVEQYARKNLASTDQSAQRLHQTQMVSMEEEWIARLMNSQMNLKIYRPNANGEPYSVDAVWAQMESRLHEYIKDSFEFFLDEFSGYNTTAMGAPSALQNWAKAGMLGGEFKTSGAWKAVLLAFEKQGITHEPGWFDENPSHPLTQLRNACMSKLDNTVGRGETGSLRKFYIDLQRPPFGLLGVPYSAFAFGFVLRECFSSRRQYQWTDGTVSQKLDTDSLAEMIEAVVRDDGNNAIRNEKLFCRLSKEEKTFVEKSGIIFGMSVNPNGTVENTLQEIAIRLEKISGKAPLWVLSDAIRDANDPYSDILCEMVDLLCKALPISSKGNVEERSSCVKRIGECLLKTDGLAEVFSGYIKPDVFTDAFKRHVDKIKPELQARAVESGDNSGLYCQVLKNQCAETAGWLWNKENVGAEIENVYAQYGVILQIQKLVGVTGHFPFSAAVARLKHAIYEENKVSLVVIKAACPALSQLLLILSAPKIGASMADLETELINQNALLRELFFDPAHKKQIALLQKLFEETLRGQGESELRSVYESLSCGTERTEADFKAQAISEIEMFFKASSARQILELWRDKTGTVSPSEFSITAGLPAAMWLNESAERYIDVICDPSACTAEKLTEAKKVLEASSFAVKPGEVQLVGERFIKRALPLRYQKLGVMADELSQALKSRLGADTNRWLQSPDFSKSVEAFICERYQSVYRKKAEEKVKALSADDAKQRLLKLVDHIPDVGFSILE